MFQSQKVEVLCILFLHLIYKAWRLLECRKLPSDIINSERSGFILAWFFKPYRTWRSWKAFQMNVTATPNARKVPPSKYPSFQRCGLVCARHFTCSNSSNSHVRPYYIFILHSLWNQGQDRGIMTCPHTMGDVRFMKSSDFKMGALYTIPCGIGYLLYEKQWHK